MLVEMLERRRLLSGTLSNIATFNGPNGFSPVAVVEDANRNLFGVTLFVDNGGATEESGEIFEVAAGTNSIKVIYQFSNTGGITSPTSLLIDASGNLFGTANTPDASGYVFELAAGATTPTILGSFPSTAQSSTTTLGSQGILTAIDSSGNLFGIDSWGNAFEFNKQTHSLALFAQTYGHQGSLTDLQIGPDGNLYGTLANTVVKIDHTTAAVTTLASLDASTTGSTPSGLAIDSGGNIWGFSQNGGANSDGAAWELAAGGNSISLISTFSNAVGTNPVCRPVFGSDGNLYGIADHGGANDDGSLFDIPAGSSAASPGTPTDLADFTSAEQTPDSGCGIIANSTGVAVGFQSDGKDIPLFGALFGSVSASSSAIRPQFGDGFGAMLEYAFSTVSSDPDEVKQRIQHDKEVLDQIIKAIKSGQPAPTNLLSRPSAGQDLAAALEVSLGPAKLTAGQLAPINKAIAAQQKNLNAATAMVNKATGLTNQYNRETKTIAALQAQLAKGKNTTAIQKKINAAQALQAKFLAQSNTALDAAVTDLDNFDTQVSTIVSQYNALLG